MANNTVFESIKAYLQQTGDNEALKGLEEGAELAQEQESTKEGVGQTFDIGMHEAGEGLESAQLKELDNVIADNDGMDDGMNDGM